MGKSGKLTEQQISQILVLIKEGYMDSEIAKMFGDVTPGAIYYQRKKLGIKTSFTYEKNSKMDHNKLRVLFEQGWSDYRIAKELGVKPCSVFSYRKLHEIQRNDNLKYNKAVEPSDFQFEVLIGILMGDGSMRKTNVNPSFVCMHGAKQKEYCQYKYELLKNLGAKLSHHKRNVIDKRTGLYYEDYTVRLSCNPALLGMYNSFYPNRKKVIPFSLFDRYSAASLAFHYMDDGYKMKNGYAIATQSFDKNDVIRFIDFLFERFGIKAKIWSNGAVYITKESSELFKSLIEPYFCDSMKYKL